VLQLAVQVPWYEVDVQLTDAFMTLRGLQLIGLQESGAEVSQDTAPVPPAAAVAEQLYVAFVPV